MKRRLCLIESCREHRQDDTWVHFVPRREARVQAHLFLASRGRAA